MSDLNIAELASTLRSQQAKWRPKENEVMKLPFERRRALLGVVPPPGYQLPSLEVAHARAAGETATFVPAVDWRNKNGNHVTPVKNQGGCGSCVSFCTVAVVESMSSIEGGQLLNLSEADQHFCSSHGASCGGWWHDQAFDQIKIRGVSDEACFPYETAFQGNDIWSNDPPTCKICNDRNNRVTKITNTTKITNMTAAKNYLTDIGPLAAVFEVFEDFYAYSTGIYQHLTGVSVGLHCVTIIGYDETGQYWICKNSWGPGWGDSGYFKIAYGQCSIDQYEKIGASGVVLPLPPHGWYGWESLGGILSSRPNAVSWAENRIDVIVRGMDSGVYHKWWDGSTWLGWESLGGYIQHAPSICSWGNGRLDIFALGTNFNLFHKWYEGGWSGWENLGGLLSSEPACVSWGNNRIDIFARGMDSALWHMWWDGVWHGWESLGGVLDSAPAVCSWANGRLDVFAKGVDNQLWHIWFEGGWSYWENLGGYLSGSPAAESWGPDRIDIFYPGQTNHMMHKWWDGAWSGEEDLGGVISSDIGVSSWATGRLDCFARGMDSQMYHKWYA